MFDPLDFKDKRRSSKYKCTTLDIKPFFDSYEDEQGKPIHRFNEWDAPIAHKIDEEGVKFKRKAGKYEFELITCTSLIMTDVEDGICGILLVDAEGKLKKISNIETTTAVSTDLAAILRENGASCPPGDRFRIAKYMNKCLKMRTEGR